MLNVSSSLNLNFPTYEFHSNDLITNVGGEALYIKDLSKSSL